MALSKIKMTGFAETATINATPGTEIVVDDSNRADAEFLVSLRCAYEIKPPAESLKVAAAAAAANNDEDDDEDDNVLTPQSPVSALEAHGIGKRYVTALVAAGAETIGQLMQSKDSIAKTPGVSDAAAKQIIEVLEKDVE